MNDIWDRLNSRDGLLLLGMNLVPLLGAILLGWDGLSIMILYWLETAVIGFWVVALVAVSPIDPLGAKFAGEGLDGRGLAAFVTLHAGIFMAVHLFMLLGLFGTSRPGSTTDPSGLIWDLVVNRGLWMPLLALFIVRGIFALADRRAGVSTGPVIIAFYVRILVMQFTVLLGGWILLIALPFGLDHSIGGVALLILLKTAAEFSSGSLVAKAEMAILAQGDRKTSK